MKNRCFLGIVVLLLTACAVEMPEEVSIAYENLPAKVDFNIHIKPLISDRCYQCHGPDKQARKGDLTLDSKAGLFAETESGNHAFVPGRVNQSEAIRRILSDDPEYMMPPPESGHVLIASEKAAMIKWVAQGAEWKEHWAFIPPNNETVPEGNKNWPQNNEIDLFVQQKLAEKDLVPSPEAEKVQLLRRVTMDLTGLPPTLPEIQAFLRDNSLKAYETVVDRLLASDACAERLTLEWLDVARYADSHGFHVDGLRKMWPWRDWVIRAFRENMPYDQFVSEQLAGDLMPHASKEQIIATAFNRNHPMTAEGGAVDEEYRIEYVTNRTNTFGAAFLGLTVECAKCHDHKFDPISQNEYYQLSAFFNNVRELGMTANDGDFGPLLRLSDAATDRKIAALDQEIATLKKKHRAQRDELQAITDFVNSKALKKRKPVLHHSFERITQTASSEYLDNRPLSIQQDTDPVEGISGKARHFNHQDDQITLKEFGQFEHTDPFSVSVWIKPDDETGKNKTVIGNSGMKAMLYSGWDLYLDSTNHIAMRLVSSLPHDYIHVKSRAVVSFNQWTHLFFSYDGSAKAEGIHLYVNGQACPTHRVYDDLEKSILPTYTWKERASDHGVRVGKSYRTQTGDNGVFKGAIDELTIFDREVFSPQVHTIYEQTRNGKVPVMYDGTDPEYLATARKLAKLRTERLRILDTIPELMVMEEMPGPRPTFVLDRGEYDHHAEQVQAGTPQKILGFSSEFDRNRLGLSQWLFDERNPLTARVAVNRYWQMIFGRGIVSTVHDFGSQGTLPSHPQLLDWLAIEFVESGWDVKALLRLMVCSHTYRQRSQASAKLREKDAANLWLARGPSYRWPAEFIRDNALAASGLLNPAIGGESVKPYQPEGLWIELGNFSRDLLHFKRDEDERQYRRSMYTFLRRTSPPPFMALFDAPSREICILTRERTNTPMQSLVLLNDPQFVEASRALAVRLSEEAGEALKDKIRIGFQLVLSRLPSEAEMAIFEMLYAEEYQEFEKDRQGTRAYLAVGDFNYTGDFDPIELAALTVLCNTLFNMDEVCMKR